MIKMFIQLEELEALLEKIKARDPELKKIIDMIAITLVSLITDVEKIKTKINQ